MLKRCISVFLFLTLCALRVSAGLADGMRFQSYEVPAEQRTSLVLPGGAHEWLTFSDSLTVSFSLKIERGKGSFGYICRMAADDLLPIDILLSPKADTPVISATADHHNMIALCTEGEDVGQWKDLYLRFCESGECLSLTANGQEVVRPADKAKRHRVTLYFGKVDAPGYATSDVAPMILADLQVRIDARKPIGWMLQDENDLSPKHSVSIRACHPVFMRDFNKRWTRILALDQPSVSYACFSRGCEEVFFVSDKQVTRVDVPSASATVRPFSREMKIPLVRDQFETLPDGTLVYMDAERGQMIRYDDASGEWDADNGRARTFTRLHNNVLYLAESDTFLEMFGYGQHRYSNTAWKWKPDGTCSQPVVLEGVAPRYLAGAGEHDGKVYVLGGKGNESGQQELGVRFYDMLTVFDPDSLAARVRWTHPALRENVAAKDLVFVEDGLYALLFNPEIHDSSLRLWAFDPISGEAGQLADGIPFPFSDVNASARLGFDRERESFVATVCYVDEGGNAHSEVWTLGYPALPAPAAAVETSFPDWLWIAVVLALILFVLLTGWLIRRKKPADTPDPLDIPPHQSIPQKPGVYLLGGFHVLDKEGNDIASSFSPILIQLLSILALYTAEKGGVSNAKLKSLLWADKSDDSFNNNKGVNLRRLRDLLSQVGDITIVQEGGVWLIEEGTGLCDVIVAKRRLEGHDVSQILGTASWGALLPEYQFEWLDPFKARYTDLVLSRLTALTEAGVSPELAVRIADCRLLFDGLDEEAVLQKCQALVSLGRVGTSKRVFERFTDEYQRIMGEEFGGDFTTFIKKNQR